MRTSVRSFSFCGILIHKKLVIIVITIIIIVGTTTYDGNEFLWKDPGNEVVVVTEQMENDTLWKTDSSLSFET